MCKNRAMRRVVVLALEEVIPFELSLASRFLGAAVDADGRPLYSVITCSLDGRPVRTSADYAISVEHDASALAEADIVVIPAARTFTEFVDRSTLPPGVSEALAALRSDTRIVGICIATFVLAAAGLLDGKTATTHWYHAARFQHAYPQVDMAPDVLFVDTGRVLTSAGAAAASTCCSTWSARTTAARWPITWPAVAWSSRSARAARPSTWSVPSPSTPTPVPPPPAPGRWSGSTTRSNWPTSPVMPE